MHTSYDVTFACSAARKPAAFKWFSLCLWLRVHTYASASIQTLRCRVISQGLKPTEHETTHSLLSSAEFNTIRNYNSTRSYSFMKFKSVAIFAAAQGPIHRGGGDRANFISDFGSNIICMQILFQASRPLHGPTQSATQWIPGYIPRGSKRRRREGIQSALVLRLRMSGAIPSRTQFTFMA
jgi:hypothetical protein